MTSSPLSRGFRACLVLGLLTLVCRADEPRKEAAPPKIDWTNGPAVARLGDIAEIKIPAGYRFTGKEGTTKFLEMTGNPPSGEELGTVLPAATADEKDSEFWFVIFEFRDVGFVRDNDRDKLDADALLKNLQENTEEANKERQRRGWLAYHIRSWYKPPFYDSVTRNLTWATEGYSTDQGKEATSVNYSVRILGRRGTMDADLVLDRELVSAAVPKFNQLLGGFSYLPGGSYGDFRAGDKVAEYGLATLIAGGATAVAAKTGLLAKLGKVIIAALAALLAFLKRAWNYIKKVLSGKAAEETPEQG
jgi:uncharacterized membrane-anchored protein